MIFIVFHGAFGSAEENWYPALKRKLESLGQTVIIPQFPTDDQASLKQGIVEPTGHKLAKWYMVFEKVLQTIPKNEKICFISHSLGCIFSLRCVEKYNLQLDCGIFVGAFLDCLPGEIWPYTVIIKDFQKTDFDTSKVKKLIPISYVLYSDTDPYVPNYQSEAFAKAIGGSVIPIRSAGHMNMEVNLDEFALVLDLCLTRLDLSYAQKYKFLTQRTGAFEYIQSARDKGDVAFDTEESMNIKLFRFQNIKETGFATLYTGLMVLQGPHSSYMEYARQAAKRMKAFDRVILLKQLKDLLKPEVKEQIICDREAGIRIFVCLYDEVKKVVPEPDFGIWDDRYTVTNQFDRKSGQPTNTLISSSEESLQQANDWKKHIMQHAVPITNPDKDIQKYLSNHKRRGS